MLIKCRVSMGGGVLSFQGVMRWCVNAVSGVQFFGFVFGLAKIHFQWFYGECESWNCLKCSVTDKIFTDLNSATFSNWKIIALWTFS